MAVVRGNTLASSRISNYLIKNSAHFDGANDFLSITFSSDDVRKDFMIEGWFQRHIFGTTQTLFSAGDGGSSEAKIFINSSDEIGLVDDSVTNFNTVHHLARIDGGTAIKLRDTEWYHIAIVYNLTAGEITPYLNGEQLEWSVSTTPNVDDVSYFLQSLSHEIGRNARNNNQYFSGNITHWRVSTGTVPSIDFVNGHPEPVRYTGGYPSNGFELLFEDAGNLGLDSSGVGGALLFEDGGVQSANTPTDVSCTWNPHTVQFTNTSATFPTLSNGNLQITSTDTWRGAVGTLHCPDKFHFRVRAVTNASSGRLHVGVVTTSEASRMTADAGTDQYWSIAERHEINDIRKQHNGFSLLSNSNYSDGDWINIWGDLRDGDGNGKIWFGKNGVPWEGDPEAGTGASYTNVAADILPFIQGFQNTVALADFETDSGTFKAIKVSNLPKVTGQLSDHFLQLPYEADEVAKTIDLPDGVNWGTDDVLAISKCATLSAEDWDWQDTVRGLGNFLKSNGTAQEDTDTDRITAFNGTSYAIGTDHRWNRDGRKYLHTFIRAGQQETGTFGGSQTITRSVNRTSGFAIITYDNVTAPATIAHGLGQEVGMIIVFERGGSNNRPVYHWAMGADRTLYLNSTRDRLISDNFWGGLASEPTDTLLTIGSASDVSRSSHVMYVFAKDSPFIKTYKYRGNSSANGPLMYLGGYPVWSLNKTYSGGASSWYLWAEAINAGNPSNTLKPNTADIQSTTNIADLLGLGFKIRTSGDPNNASYETCGIAFVEPVGPGRMPRGK